MKKILIFAATICAIGTANANIYTFVPNPSNLDNLDHYKYYSWGINWTPPANEVIVEAVLKIRNIYNWQEEENYLYTHLLDDVNPGFHTFTDDQGGGDAWAGSGPMVGVYSDPAGGHATGFNLIYSFSELGLVDDLQNFAQDGSFGLGFDPDCHYFNEGASFKITTQAVPEPATMCALGLGVLGIVRRRAVRKASA